MQHPIASTYPPLRIDEASEYSAALRALLNYLRERFCYATEGSDPDDEGSFDPPQEPDGPVDIRVYRYDLKEIGPAINELAVLTHEAGHWLSWITGLRPAKDAYDKAVDVSRDKPSLLGDEKGMVYGEEIVAWNLGPQVLKAACRQSKTELPETFWSYYATKRADGLRKYRELYEISDEHAERWQVRVSGRPLAP